MRRIVFSLIATGLLLGLPASPVQAHGANAETYTANAPVPFSTSEFANSGGCSNGVEGVHKDSHPFSRPVPGTLDLTMTTSAGDWDIHIFDADTGVLVAQGVRFTGTEIVSAPVQAGQNLILEACNFAGPPTATVDYTFTPAADNFVSLGDVRVPEGDGGTRPAVFTVSLAKPSASTVTVAYATANDSALRDLDYVATSGSVSLPPGVTSIPVKVMVNGDTEDEADEAFTVTLTGATNVALGDARGVATIVDDDPAVSGKGLAIGDVSIHEGDAGTRAAVFTVSLSRPSVVTVTVAFATADGTATAPGDYAARSGTVSLAPGATSAKVKVPVASDTTNEAQETFNVVLSGSSGPTIADGTGTATIIDND
ncbi:MAG: Calx-beta domain-containing protein [Acidimicrobiales bacterium]